MHPGCEPFHPAAGLLPSFLRNARRIGSRRRRRCRSEGAARHHVRVDLVDVYRHGLVAVSARWLGTPVIAVEARPSPDTRVRRYVGRFRSGEVQFLPIMVTRTAWLATSPTALYHALSFYGSHPDLRTELGTPDAVDRISSGRAVGQQEP